MQAIIATRIGECRKIVVPHTIGLATADVKGVYAQLWQKQTQEKSEKHTSRE